MIARTEPSCSCCPCPCVSSTVLCRVVLLSVIPPPRLGFLLSTSASSSTSPSSKVIQIEVYIAATFYHHNDNIQPQEEHSVKLCFPYHSTYWVKACCMHAVLFLSSGSLSRRSTTSGRRSSDSAALGDLLQLRQLEASERYARAAAQCGRGGSCLCGSGSTTSLRSTMSQRRRAVANSPNKYRAWQLWIYNALEKPRGWFPQLFYHLMV